MRRTTSLETLPTPWEHQPGEGLKPFAAFKAYLEMGPARSASAVGRKLGKSGGLMERWCAAYGWRGRVSAYEAYLDAVRREEEAKAERGDALLWAERRANQRREQFETSEALLTKAMAMLAMPIVTQKVSKDGKEITITPTRWSFATVCQMIDVAMKLRVLALTEPTTHPEGTDWSEGASVPESNLTDEQVFAILDTYRKGRSEC
jgi:hypothetical protein